MSKKVVCIVGTRPEAIKMAPVILAFQACSWSNTIVVSTGQHNRILHETLSEFGISANIDLDLMESNQTLASLTGRLFTELDPVLANIGPDLVLAQGDTTTVMAVSVICFYRKLRFGHVEAGLRTYDLQHPFPEEFNRTVTARIANIHFAPTQPSRNNLIAEGVPEANIHVTGNTIIDALLKVAADADKTPTPECILPFKGRCMVLVTAHRRENFGEPIEQICSALHALSSRFPALYFVYPVHPNPNIDVIIRTRLAGAERIILLPPVNYRAMVMLLQAAHFVLTDSGGIQEEAPALGKPVLVLRDRTERREAVEAGVVKLVGTEESNIVAECSRLLTDKDYYSSMAKGISPYGDGHAGPRIVAISKKIIADGVEAHF
jgi:UDP-N-acetylglucosamine 2-epimerase (non-hydrolysing)